MYKNSSTLIFYFAKFTILLLVVLGSFENSRAQNQRFSLEGRVFDPAGATIVGAKVTLQNSRQNFEAVTNSDGIYKFENLPEGSYSIEASSAGFAVFRSQDIAIPLKNNQRFDIRLSIEIIEEVTADVPQISVDSDKNADSIVLRGKDLDVLPEDPEDLAASLQALVPAAGPGGGQIVVDGFTNGRVPPKGSIREIRVSNNPFNAEYDQPGFGRIEILTKPGMDKFHGTLSFNFNDESLNSRNPFSPNRADFQTRLYGFNLSGPVINKKASFFFDFQRREEDDNSLINANILTNALQPLNIRQVVANPKRFLTINPRFDLAINQNNILIARYSYIRNVSEANGIGGFSLDSRGTDLQSNEQNVQLTYTSFISPRAVNETRFQFLHRTTEQVPRSNSPSVIALDSFNNGNPLLGSSELNEKRWDLENFTTYTVGKHILRFGTKLRQAIIKDKSPSNFNGTFIFTGGAAPLLNSSNQPVLDGNGNPIITTITSLERFRRTVLFQRSGLSPAQVRSLGGGASQFTLAGGSADAKVNRFDLSLYLQDEWRLRPNLVLTLGLRYENQTNISSNSNFAPRLFVAWAPGGNSTGTSVGSGSSQPKLVFRLGTGIFYDRFSELGTLETNRFDGVNQLRFNISDPTVFGQTIFETNSVSNVPTISNLTNLGLKQNISRVADNFRAPYTFLTGLQVEYKLPRNLTLFGLAFRYRTVNVLRLRNVNAPLPGTFSPGIPGSGVRPSNQFADVYQYESSGFYEDRRLILGLRGQINKNISFFTNYSTGLAKSDTDCAFGILAQCFPANSYDLNNEYGRVAFIPKHRVVLGGSFFIPQFKVSLSPTIIASTGQFFNIITGRDTNGDGLFTERPAFATATTLPQNLRVTEYGSFDINPAPGTPLIPRNYGEAPNFFVVNLNINRTFGFNNFFSGGKNKQSSTGKTAAQTPSTGDTRYKFILGLNILNLFNRTNFATPIGNLSSPVFGNSIGIAGPFGGAVNNSNGGNRRIQAQARFTF